VNRTLTPQERAACEAFIAERGITRLPTGASTQPRYIWDDATKQLVQIEGKAIGWRDRKKTRKPKSHDAHLERRKQEQADRREKVIELYRKGFGRIQIADMLGTTPRTISRDRKELIEEGRL
jgi:DNA-binding NarL/FixJ family response regulator